MTITPDDIYNLIHQGESISVEIKKCSDSVPRSVWETYSASANIREWVIDEGSTVNSINGLSPLYTQIQLKEERMVR